MAGSIFESFDHKSRPDRMHHYTRDNRYRRPSAAQKKTRAYKPTPGHFRQHRTYRRTIHKPPEKDRCRRRVFIAVLVWGKFVSRGGSRPSWGDRYVRSPPLVRVPTRKESPSRIF